jgi:5'-3' exonuclease
MKYTNLIIDGNNFLFRAFYSKRPARLLNGLNLTPIYQSLYMLKVLAEWYSPEKIFFTWDKRLNPDFVNFRRQIVGEYKENRVDTDDKKNVLSYMEIIVDFCNSLGIRTILPYDLEGDDVIYYLCQKLKDSTLIVSSDRDLLQLVDDRVHQLIPTRNIIVTLENFKEFTSVAPEAFLLFKAILGDKSDNISGFPKYGEIKAKSLAEKLISQTISNEKNIILTEEQEQIIKNNLRIMNLANAILERPDEHNHYEKQFHDSEKNKFNSEEFKKLCSLFGCDNFLREIGTWKRLFDSNIDESSWINDPLDFITM